MASRTNRIINPLIVVFVLVTTATTLAGKIIYVDHDATGANDGSSWNDAYNYVQNALAKAQADDEIHVAQGIYKPDKGAGVTSGDREATFQLISGVALYGGFPSGGGSWEDRDPNTYESILSGDLTGNDEPVDNPADLLADPNRAENSYQIVTGSGADETAILDGFTVMGGNADGSYPNSRGSGLFQCAGPISNCTISGNSAVESGGGLYACAGPITKCTISDNSANYGGGIYGGSLTIIDCIFIGNVSQTSGGGWDAPSNSRLINCLFSGNRTGGAGGAIFCPCTSIEMINCTVTGNVAEGEGFYRGGGICGDDDTDMFLTNCIFWGNRDFDGMIESSQIWQDYVSQTHVNHCCVQGWTGILGGSHNHGNYPRFVDPNGADDIAGTLDDNLRLQANSYCVNAGDNDAVPPSVLTDLDGNQRIFDGVVDQGAYENASTEPPQIAHWKLDESGGDIAEDSAWNHDGKLQGDPIWRSQCGRIAGALEFDGQGDYVNCGNDSNFNITGAITLAAWIKTESSSGKKTILAKHDDAWRIRIQNGNFELVLPGLSSEQWFTVSGSAVNDNHWHHVLGVYDGHSIASVYIDGSKDASREATGSLNTNDEDVCIGRNSLFPERDFVGRIDDVQVYDYALTDDEIADLAYPPTIYHVDSAATGEENGFCWSDAFVELQTALAAAESGDQIWMAAGSHLPDYDLNTGSHTCDRHASFLLQKDIVIQGGYAGYGAADPYERDIQKYETILSGDLLGNDTPGLIPENLLTDLSRSDNSWTVILASGVNRSAVLDGCTVYGGQADIKYTNEPTGNGGGIYMERGNPTLRNCTFRANAAADSGGGFLNDAGLPLLLNCCFEGNYCGWSGGGLCNLWGSPTLQGCRFENNYAGTGAGLYNLTYYLLTLDRCTFNSNVTTYRGGGIMIYEYEGQTILNNCLLTGNQAPEGGAIGCDAEESGTLTLNNCTIAENEAEKTGGGIFSRYRGLAINNCIFWANADSTGYTETAQIHVPSPAPNYTCVQGWTGQWPGIGNIGSAPFFVDPINGDYHLLTRSPCIDTGDPNYIAGPNEADLDGKPRVINGRVDIGAYEYSPPIQTDLRIVPRTINLASSGKWITAFLRLSEGYNVADIDSNSILLKYEIEPDSLRIDEAEQVAIARFNREDVQDILHVGEIELTITGRLTDGTVFEGTDTIKVLNKAGK